MDRADKKHFKKDVYSKGSFARLEDVKPAVFLLPSNCGSLYAAFYLLTPEF